ncbi:TIR domain-containing adapter molecule 2 [Podarcis raffonei]|uniref:TIR domain-containing adapter molecule 2 n=1 Tax=Podarcis raffonei TaxID=65483 RepID=UPI0023294073|nr:TIR domain-containing adapter molecule 2 [Podarcis raffonei]
MSCFPFSQQRPDVKGAETQRLPATTSAGGEKLDVPGRLRRGEKDQAHLIDRLEKLGYFIVFRSGCFAAMGNGNSKRTFPFSPRNGVKDNRTNPGQEGFKQKPKTFKLSLGEETSGDTNTEEIHSSDEDAGDVFYRFVVLHAEEDVEEAARVQDLLQNEFCIKPGIIFAEMPGGRHLFENLKDAMNGSAWIIILLTENFLSELWCEFQFCTCLFSALTIPHKGYTVIPMRPRNNPLPRERTPFILQTINTLQEDSPGFAQQVKNIFQDSRYRQQQAIWQYEKKKEEVQKLVEWQTY